MAEGRMLKKRISESKKLAALKSDSSRLLYTWLIPWLDVEGRYMADPEIIKGHIFPKIKSWNAKKIEKHLGELASKGIELILLYDVDGERYLQFSKFHEIQKVRRDREGASKIPSPKKGKLITPGVIPDNSGLREVKLNQGKLSESKLSEIYVEYKIDKFKTIKEFFQSMFDEMWDAWPKDGRLNKQAAKEKFFTRCWEGKMIDIIKGANGYFEFLRYKKREENFDQRAMYPATFLEPKKERWKEYIGFKIKPRL